MQRTYALMLIVVFLAVVIGLTTMMLQLGDPIADADLLSLPDQKESLGPASTFAPTPVYTRSPELGKLIVEDRELLIPYRDHGNAVWGATGRDRKGRIWFGVSGAAGNDSRLVRYDPADGSIASAGGVLDALRKAGLLRDGERQGKIHSRIVGAADGNLYFASMDETGEDAKQGKLPRWGSHLWRIDPSSMDWEHLGTAPEALIAVAAGGQWIYALGYWDHVLYQFDTLTQKLKSIAIGSAQGHVSRNLVANEQGHVFVPRVQEQPPGSGDFVASLVELNPDLLEIQATPLDYYMVAESPGSSHGIVGVADQKDGSRIILVNGGALYRIGSSGLLPAEVRLIGRLPESPDSRGESLFDLDGRDYLAGALRTNKVWKIWVMNWQDGVSRVFPLDWRSELPSKLLYGSMTRDDQGSLYLGGQVKDGKERLAVALRVTLLEGLLDTVSR
ncbi:MAG: hypothetical protein KDH88_18910 [Chromatiales bacterium]|nr:hypothetical protein [Chromatiales bacterium]